MGEARELQAHERVLRENDFTSEEVDALNSYRQLTNSPKDSELYKVFEAMKKNAEVRGVEISTWPKEMMDQFRSAWEEVVQEQRKDPTFAVVYDDLKNFRDNYKLWSSRAFINRD